jgi:Uma2 family endonuclease
MSLAEFENASATEGRSYELSRGTVIVTDVPNPPHTETLDELRQQLSAYRAARPGIIRHLLGGAECKLLIEGTQSERHPDLAVYKTASPGRDSTVWSVWVPEIVAEVVSPGPDSAHRDYVEKAEDYLLFGVLEYWVVDAPRGVVTVHRRVRGRWQLQELRAGGRYATHLLPGFELDAAALLPA